MLITQQTALVQATNQQLVQIRQSEMNYYLNVVSIFGQQAALISGFAYSSLTQISFSPYTGFWFYNYAQDAFWVCTAVCMGVSLHVILVTIYLQVYGQGLSIHGPIGSMARAVHGMREETKEVFAAYIIMVITFSGSMVTSFWTVMTIRAASFCTAFFLLVSLLWWRYCLRIYNKFYVKRLFIMGDDSSGGSSAGVNSVLNDERDPTKRPISRKGHSASGPPVDSASSKTNESSSTKSSFFGRVFGGAGSNKGGGEGGSTSGYDGDSAKGASSATAASTAAGGGGGQGAADGDDVDILLSGYLTLNETETAGNLLKFGQHGLNNIWTRRYFVLYDEGELFYYIDKRHFFDYADRPIKTRPLRVQEYDIICNTTSVDDAPVFEIMLQYKDKEEGIRPWLIRCDTEDELEQWSEALTRASQIPY